MTARTVKALPLEDVAEVAARRAALGLPPLAEEVTRAQVTPPPGLPRPAILHAVFRAFPSGKALNTALTTAEFGALVQEAARLVEQDETSRLG